MNKINKCFGAAAISLMASMSYAQSIFPHDVPVGKKTTAPSVGYEVMNVNSDLIEVNMDMVNMCKMKGMRFSWDQLVVKLPENLFFEEETESIKIYISDKVYDLDLSEKGKYVVKDGRTRYFEVIDGENPYYEIIIDGDDYYNNGAWPQYAIIDVKTKQGTGSRFKTEIILDDANIVKEMPFSVFFEQGYVGTNTLDKVDSELKNVVVKYHVEYEDYGKTYSIDVPMEMADKPMYYEVLDSKNMKRLEVYYDLPGDGSHKKIRYKVQIDQKGSPYFEGCELPLR